MASRPLLTTAGDTAPEEETDEIHNELKTIRARRRFCGRWTVAPSLEPYLRRPESLPDLRKGVEAVIPTFLHGLFTTKSSKPAAATERLHDTAYLDGIRGLASVVVYVSHLAGYVYTGMIYTYGLVLPPDNPHYDPNNLETNRYILQLPILRCFSNASMMVSLFFVISGFALSIGPIKRMHAGDEDKLLRNLSSSAFRRPIRLYLPTFISTVMPFILIRLGFYEASSQILREGRVPNPFSNHIAHPLRTFWAEFKEWVMSNVKLVFLCGPMRGSRFNNPVWTIPQEFASSLYLYLTQLALGHLRPRARMSIVFVLIVIALLADLWSMSLFWGGFLIAEWDSLVTARDARTGSKSFSNIWWKAFFLMNFLMASYLGSYPGMYGDTAPGFIWLSKAIPENWSLTNRFWEAIGAMQMIMAISRLPEIKGWLSRPTIRYLGYISFGLYLTHIPIVRFIGIRLLALFYSKLDSSNDLACFVGFALALLITSIPVFWMADLFTRYVDIPCTNFGKKLEAMLVMGT